MNFTRLGEHRQKVVVIKLKLCVLNWPAKSPTLPKFAYDLLSGKAAERSSALIEKAAIGATRKLAKSFRPSRRPPTSPSQSKKL